MQTVATLVEDFNNGLLDDPRQPPAALETLIRARQPDLVDAAGWRAIDAAETELVFLLDDDQIVTPDLHLDRVYERFMEHNLDILAVRQGGGGQPMMLSPLMNGKRIWMHRGEYKRIGPVCWCDMVSNAFLARRDTIARVRWDDAIKTYEHWEFFYRASRIEKLAIAVAVDCTVVHAHVGAKPYGDLRGRPKFRAMGLRKHGFHSMRYPGGGIVNA